jgi:ankyrin repeat protein
MVRYYRHHIKDEPRTSSTDANSALYSMCVQRRLALNNSEETAEENDRMIRQWLNSNEHNEACLTAAAKYKDRDLNNTPLHEIVRKAHPPIDVVEKLIKYAPEALKTKTYPDGWFPLNLACCNKASLEVIEMLLKAFPKSAALRSRFGWLPLHEACHKQASLDVLNLLIEAYPQSIHERDYMNNIPSRYLNGGSKLLLHKAVTAGFSVHLVKFLLTRFPERCLEKDEYGMIPLHYACSLTHVNSADLVKLLLEASPEGCLMKDSKGRVPLHHACSSLNNNTGAAVDVVVLLIDVNPESVAIVDNEGRTPTPSLHFSQAASQKDENGMLLLHRLAARPTSNGITINMLYFLVNAYPESISVPDNSGMLPFHHACLNTLSSVDILTDFINLYPECLLCYK